MQYAQCDAVMRVQELYDSTRCSSMAGIALLDCTARAKIYCILLPHAHSSSARAFATVQPRCTAHSYTYETLMFICRKLEVQYLASMTESTHNRDVIFKAYPMLWPVTATCV
jgi:hypothetical protein